MQLIPRTLEVVLPTAIPEERGIRATSPPHGVATSYRCTLRELAEVDEAVASLGISRSTFIRLATLHVAQAVNQHITRIKEQVNG